VYKAGDKIIYQATSDSLKSNDKWLVKVKPNSSLDEISTLLYLRQESPGLVTDMPISPYHKFGMTPESIWFAMRQYDSHITKAHTNSWQEIAITCLEFLQALHKDYKRVYMDFRAENVLVNGKKFIISDYELVTQIESRKLKRLTRSTRWYYMGRGGEPNEWVYSWKMDFVSLGYMLIRLTSKKDTSICDELMERRAGLRKNHLSMKQLAKQRNAIMYDAANPTLKAYLDTLKDIMWNEWEPPMYSFYKKLIHLFREAKK